MSNPPPAGAGATPPPPMGQWQPPPAYHQYQRPVAPNGQPLAQFSDRFVAYLIDYAIYFVITLLYTIPFMIWWFNYFFDQMEGFVAASDPYSDQPPFTAGDMFELYMPMLLFSLVSLVFGVAYTYFYFVEFQLRRGGQTVGKRVMKVKVIPAAPEQNLARAHLVKRWLLQWVAAMFVPFLSLLDGLWQLWDKPWQQCLHDKVAATVVVKVG